MSKTLGTRGGLGLLLGCIAMVALVTPRTLESRHSDSLAATPVAASPTISKNAQLAVQVADAYKTGERPERYCLGVRKLFYDRETRDFLFEALNTPAIIRTEILHQLLNRPVDDDWPEEAVLLSRKGASPEAILSLSEPVADPKVPGRFYFLSGQGEEYLENLTILTVELEPDGGLRKLQYDLTMSVHAPAGRP